MAVRQQGSRTPSSAPGAGQWQAQTFRDDHALARLADEWEELYQRCSVASPFASYAWVDAWWRSYGRPGQLLVTVVRRGGRLVAASALTRRRPAVLTAVGAGVSDFTDVLLDDACAAPAARRLAGELSAQCRGRVIDLPEVPPTAAAWLLAGAWPGRTWPVPSSTCLELPALAMDELIATLPTTAARRSRKKARKNEAAGVRARLSRSHEVADRVATMIRLHEQQWQGRGMNPEHGRARFAAHLTRALPVMVERRQALLVEYWSGSSLMAVDVLVVGHRMAYAYLYGIRPELRQLVDVTHLMLDTSLGLTCELGLPALSLLRGDEPHKRHWRPRPARNHRLLLAGPGYLPGAAYAAGVRARARLGRVVTSRLPGLRTTARRIAAWSPSCT
jgi:hypothetical protein